MASYEQISYNSPDGAIFGKSSTEKIGFYGTTPQSLPAGLRHVSTTAATSSVPYGYSSTQANQIVTALNALIDLFTDQ